MPTRWATIVGVEDSLLVGRLARGKGVVTAAELRALGIGHNGARRLVRLGQLTWVRQGVYLDTALLSDEPSAVARHVATSRAILRQRTGYALSHVSAVGAWRLPVIEEDLGPIHLSGVGAGRARRSDTVRTHPPVAAVDVTVYDGMTLVRPALAVVQTALDSGVRAGVVAADAGLRGGWFGRDDLALAMATLASRSGRRMVRARLMVELASPRSESVGESWCRVLFAALGMAQPAQQVDIHDERGCFVARVDFLDRGTKTVIEFDGLTKYAGALGRDALVAEKRREDAIRRLGYRVVRLTWADLSDPERAVRLLGGPRGAPPEPHEHRQ